MKDDQQQVDGNVFAHQSSYEKGDRVETVSGLRGTIERHHLQDSYVVQLDDGRLLISSIHNMKRVFRSLDEALGLCSEVEVEKPSKKSLGLTPDFIDETIDVFEEDINNLVHMILVQILVCRGQSLDEDDSGDMVSYVKNTLKVVLREKFTS